MGAKEEVAPADVAWFDDIWERLNESITAAANTASVTTTDIIYVGDCSGSMESMGKEPLNALNAFIEDQKKNTDNDTDPQLYLYLFDHTIKVQQFGSLGDFTRLKSYPSGGTTALLDCIGTAITNYEHTGRNNPVVFVILTDGLENASKEFTQGQIREMISSREAPNGEWKFVFLASNQDSFSTGSSLGIKHANCADFCTARGAEGITRIVTDTSDNIHRYRSAVAANRASSQSMEVDACRHTQ